MGKRLVVRWIGYLLCYSLMQQVSQVYAADLNGSIARMGTSSAGSTYYVIANGLAELMRKRANINMTVEPIGGSYANIFSLHASKIDYAITNSGAAFDGRYGNKPFTQPVPVSLIAQGQVSLRFILVRRDAHIKSVADLNGKILIGARPALPEMAAISNALIKVAGLDDVRIVSTKDTRESLRHIVAGTVDAVIIPGGLHLPAIVQLFRDQLVDLLPIEQATIAAMQQQLPAYIFTRTVPAGNFEGQLQPVTIFGLNTYLVAGQDVSEEQVYLMTRTLFENLQEFGTLHAEAKQWSVQNTLNQPGIPFHPGAIRYFREKNLWSPELQQLQEKLQK